MLKEEYMQAIGGTTKEGEILEGKELLEKYTKPKEIK